MLVRESSAYIEDARRATRDQLPLFNWLGFHPIRTAKGFTAYTTGLSSFGLRELEALDSTRAAPDLVEILADLAHYQLATGHVLKSGDTFGGSAEERIRVRYAGSEFFGGAETCQFQI